MRANDPQSFEPDGGSQPPDSYLTLAVPGRSELKIQRSRFIGAAAPAPDMDTARRFIAAQARRFHDSRHVCHGWRLGPPPDITENRNDAGEPSGTAGEPILAEIRKRELIEVVVVVVRYFGGVKLGTGGLARAYGEAAATALDAGTQRTVRQGRTFHVQFPYPLQKTLQHVLTRHTGEIRRESYGAEVSWTIWLPHSCWRAFAADLTETTSGTITLETQDS